MLSLQDVDIKNQSVNNHLIFTFADQNLLKIIPNGQCNNGENSGIDLNCGEWNFDGGDCNNGIGPDLVVDRDYIVKYIRTWIDN